MPLTNFPNGVSSWGVPQLGIGPFVPMGKVLFVQSSHSLASNSNIGEDRDKPLATIDFAVGRCSANAGDIIVVGPGHVETVNAAGALTLDVAGISVLGVGNGNLRPLINFTTATSADMNVDAANVLLHNLLFQGSIDALTAPIDVNAADLTIHNCEYRDSSATQCVDGMVADSSSDRLRILNYRYRGDAAAGTSAGIALVGCDQVVIDGLYMDGNFSVGGINIRNSAVLDLEVRNVWFRTRNAADIFLVDTVTGSTGLIGPNLNLRLNDNAANITEAVTGATFVYFDPIYVVNLAGEKGMLMDKTASTDA